MKPLTAEHYIVGIGASAGGLDAIQKLFAHMPPDTGMSFVIVQHLSPDFKSLMPELLAKHTSIPIFTAEDKQVIKPDCIYLSQRNKNLHIKDDKLYLLDQGPKHNLNLPIDIFFQTLGEEYKEKSIGIILSGTGSDGSRGIKTIKEAGGTVIVQEPESAQFNGMPNAAIATNVTDYIQSPESIGDVLVKIPLLRLTLTRDLLESDSSDLIFYNILDEVYKVSGIDFKKYKRNTLLRRIEKRLNINNIDQIFDYLIFLKSNQAEKELLKQDFLIGVTRFFRDKEAFDRLKQTEIPELFKDRIANDTVRLWVVSCSTGEEAYSVAMLVDEFIKQNDLKCDFKIFATDVDAIALQTASAGIYSINNATEMDRNYFENYFTKTGDSIQIAKRIRDKIVFSHHNILKDTPFIRMDFISCRNVLIYFNNNAQIKVLINLLFALNNNGILFLGSSESLGDMQKHFRVLDSKWKIFQNISGDKPSPLYENPEVVRLSSYQYRNTNETFSKSEQKSKEKSDQLYHQYLSQRYGPSCIFYDKDYNILFIKGNAGKYLSLNEGVFQSNLLKMLNPELAKLVQTGTRRLSASLDEVVIKGVEITDDQNLLKFNLSFQRTIDMDELKEAYMLYFDDFKKELAETIEFRNISADEFTAHRIQDLEGALDETKQELQRVVEELETSNEELQSSNEELMASNEELQSTNEELQSVNEELYTVNYELQDKNKELVRLNNDVTNLLNSTDVGTLFLDADLRIRKFTPGLEKHFNLKPDDFGRPISDFAANFNDNIRHSIISDAKQALKTLVTIEDEIQDDKGNYYLRRVSPFVTVERMIDGVVITFVDITKMKELYLTLENHEKELAKNAKYYQSIVENNSFYVVKTDLQGNYTYLNNFFCQMFGIQQSDWIGRSSMDLIIPEDHHLCLETIEKCFAEPDKSFWLILRKPSIGGIIHSQWEFILLKDEDGNFSEFLCLGHEISSLVKKQQELQALVDINGEQNHRLMQFTHIVSHNIRSHVANLKGIINMAEKKKDSNGESAWQLIQRTTHSLDETIHNLNETINIQTNADIPLRLVKMKDAVAIVVNSLNLGIRESKTTIHCDFNDNAVIYSNPAYIDSIMLNLISNAIKYRSPLRVPKVTVTLEETKDNYILKVTDNGLGIDIERHKDKLFGMYKTFHSNKDAKGLGLFITRIQVEAMKGKIEVESAVDKGSTFTVYLPSAEQQQKEKKTTKSIEQAISI